MAHPEALARRLWTVAEPIHAVTYFAPESGDAYDAAGLTGFWRRYFAGRAAPMGPVSAGPVIASFFNFQPDFVRRAVPDVWSRISPDDAIAARSAGAASALRRMADDAFDGEGLTEAVELMGRIAAAADPAGRPLFAANVDVAWPDDPVAALWHGATVLREHRGDGHVAALVSAGLGGCEAHLLRLAVAGSPPDWLEPFRGWSEAEQGEALDRLVARGLIAGDARATEVGRAQVEQVEARTDRLAASPLEHLGPAQVERLLELLDPIARVVEASGAIPYPNPIGLPPRSFG